MDSHGVTVFEHMPPFEPPAGQPARLAAGQRVVISGTVENPLAPGRYKLSCWVARKGELEDLALQAVELLDFVVYGSRPTAAKVTVPGDLAAVPQEPPR